MIAATRPPAVLVVEDSQEDFETVCEAIQRSGLAAEVRHAQDGDECLRLLHAAPVRPDVVLMDLNTPGTDGREALALIKGDAKLRGMPVIVFSTSADPRDLAYCYDTGANAYHVKPVRYLEHRQLVADLLAYWLGRVALPEAGGGV